MHLDVVELRQFYSSTQLGRMAQRTIRERLRALWPNVKGESVVGFGYAARRSSGRSWTKRRAFCA